MMPLLVLRGCVLGGGLRGRFATARLIVVAEDARALIDAIRRMGIVDVIWIACMQAARVRCDQSDVDACLVVLPNATPDEQPAWTAETSAPGQGRVPALLLAEAVTPYVKRCSRAAGYAGSVPIGLPPRLLYRAIGALLQASGRRAGPLQHAQSIGGIHTIVEAGLVGKPRLQ